MKKEKMDTRGVWVVGPQAVARPSERRFLLVKTPRYCLTNDPNVAMHFARCLLACVGMNVMKQL